MNIQFHRHSSHREQTQADSNSIDETESADMGSLPIPTPSGSLPPVRGLSYYRCLAGRDSTPSQGLTPVVAALSQQLLVTQQVSYSFRTRCNNP